MQYTTIIIVIFCSKLLFYQDFKDTFVCNTQLWKCSKILGFVVLSGFQRYFCMQYTTHNLSTEHLRKLFYQDFKDTFVCNTQQFHKLVHQIPVVLSGFQRYFCMQYTTQNKELLEITTLFYQDFKDTFVCNTQLSSSIGDCTGCCFIRISKIRLYAIHNTSSMW